MTRPMVALVVLALFSTPKATNARQEGAKRTFSVADRAQITLSANWSQRFDIDPGRESSLQILPDLDERERTTR